MKLSALLTISSSGDFAADRRYGPAAMSEPLAPSTRKLAGIGLILLLIVVWAVFVASLARIVGAWPIAVQTAFYLVMGLIWIVPLKPLVRWIQTGSFRVRR